MRRSFPILALAALLSLLASLVAGLGAAPEAPAAFPMLGSSTVAVAHALAAIYLESTGHRLGAIALADGLPDWVTAQAEKNRRRACLYLWLGLPTSPILALLKARGIVVGPWSLGLMAANLAYQAGAFAAEFVIMGAQARLLRDVERVE